MGAPRRRARIACVITFTCVWTGLPPQMTTRSACSPTSRKSTPRLAPAPAIHPASARATQIVPCHREYFIT
jgi:hypothetical protein